MDSAGSMDYDDAMPEPKVWLITGSDRTGNDPSARGPGSGRQARRGVV